MSDVATVLMDHSLAADELVWVKAVYADFSDARAACAGRVDEFDPKETLRMVLDREAHRLPSPMDLSGPGPWRNGRNHHGRLVTAVFLTDAELHQHENSRTDQFPIYVIGEADAFTIEDGQPALTPVLGGDHFHNPPGAPHAFVPKTDGPAKSRWEIAFIAITPRNLKDDTQRVSHEVRAAYRQVVGVDAPSGS